jgi:hypothetical protein
MPTAPECFDILNLFTNTSFLSVNLMFVFTFLLSLISFLSFLLFISLSIPSSYFHTIIYGFKPLDPVINVLYFVS